MAYDYRLRSAVAATVATVSTFLFAVVATTGNSLATATLLITA